MTHITENPLTNPTATYSTSSAGKYRCESPKDITHYCQRECYKCRYAVDIQQEQIIELLTEQNRLLKRIDRGLQHLESHQNAGIIWRDTK